jgi:ethanolamine ammonia-lyase small subunit
VFVIVDGLSALAVERHALALLDATLKLLDSDDWQVGPACVVEQGRVAIADEIGESLGAAMTVVLIGERPGLSSADSLGIYLTWQPRVGRTDAERNCISNVRAEGLGYEDAARRIVYYMHAARRLGGTGVALKESSASVLPSDALS